MIEQKECRKCQGKLFVVMYELGRQYDHELVCIKCGEKQ